MLRACTRAGARTKIDELARYVEARDLAQVKTRLHVLMGLTGQLGAKAIYESAQFFLDAGHSLLDSTELLKFRRLLAHTEREIKVHIKRRRATA